MDIAIIALTFIGSYILFVIVLLAVARVIFPKIEEADLERPRKLELGNWKPSQKFRDTYVPKNLGRKLNNNRDVVYS